MFRWKRTLPLSTNENYMVSFNDMVRWRIIEAVSDIHRGDFDFSSDDVPAVLNDVSYEVDEIGLPRCTVIFEKQADCFTLTVGILAG